MKRLSTQIFVICTAIVIAVILNTIVRGIGSWLDYKSDQHDRYYFDNPSRG